MTIILTSSSLLFIGGVFAFFRERFYEQPLSPGYLEGLGFEKNDWTDDGVPFYEGWAKDEVMLEHRNGKYYLDGTDFEIRTVGQLKKLYEGLTGEKL